MYSLAFPKMLTNTTTKIVSGYDATYNNLKLLLQSEKYSLFGDPYFGSSLKKLTFEQNNQILYDLVVDDIYIAILTFLPQIKLERRNIVITPNRAHIGINITATNLLDYTTDLYSITLTQSGDK